MSLKFMFDSIYPTSQSLYLILWSDWPLNNLISLLSLGIINSSYVCKQAFSIGTLKSFFCMKAIASSHSPMVFEEVKLCKLLSDHAICKSLVKIYLHFRHNLFILYGRSFRTKLFIAYYNLHVWYIKSHWLLISSPNIIWVPSVLMIKYVQD